MREIVNLILNSMIFDIEKAEEKMIEMRTSPVELHHVIDIGH
jgi:hypothetical protein